MILQNPFASPRFNKEPYNYESNLLCNFRITEMMSIVEKSCETCPKCQLRKKNHYCIEPKCLNKLLICPECDVASIAEAHYLHDHTFILPLLSKDIYNNFYRLKRKITSYHQDILEEIVKMEEYLAELRKIEETARKRMEELEIEEQRGKIKDYVPKMEEFLRNKQEHKLSSILRNVSFKSAQDCTSKEQQVRTEIINHLNSLKWPKDPQKVLKEKFLKPAYDDEKREIFVSAKKTLELNEIDANFRTNQEFYTQNLQNHQIEIKLETDYLNKQKFYESFIHHFRNCKHLSIDNGSLNHLKTPLTFRRLKSLQFCFTTDLESSPNTKIENVNGELTSLTFRKFREEDTKMLKTIAHNCSQLKKVHIEFANKIDLFNYKDLLDFLESINNSTLVNFTLKIRTQNEVKRLYGYLSKFYKEFSSEVTCNLTESIIQMLGSSPFLTKVVIEGIKPLNMNIVLGRLKRLIYLMDYKIYYENIDLMTEVDDKQAKQLQDLCYKRKRLFYSLAKASKEKRYPRSIINKIAEQMLI